MTNEEIMIMARNIAGLVMYKLADNLDQKIKTNGETLENGKINETAIAFLAKRIDEQKVEAKAYRIIAREITAPPRPYSVGRVLG